MKRWVKWVLLLGAVLWGLWIASGEPWVPYGLWHDVTYHEALFRQAAAQASVKGTIERGDPQYKPIFDMGYYKIQMDSGIVLFFRYEHFMGRGILGVAYKPYQETSGRVADWYEFTSVPPFWSSKQMPTGFYIFSGR